MHDLHAVLGFGGIIEMMMHIKNTYANIIKQFCLVCSCLRAQGLSGINEMMMYIKENVC